MTQRLQSFHSNNRKDAAYTLGRLGDPRAVPSLIHVLKYDSSKDVRIASAIALGEIGGSDAAVALERCAIYDHKEEVRKAATTALDRLNAQGQEQPRRSRRRCAVDRRRPPPAGDVDASPFRESPPPAQEPPGPAGEPRRRRASPPRRSRRRHRRPSRPGRADVERSGSGRSDGRGTTEPVRAASLPTWMIATDTDPSYAPMHRSPTLWVLLVAGHAVIVVTDRDVPGTHDHAALVHTSLARSTRVGRKPPCGTCAWPSWAACWRLPRRWRPDPGRHPGRGAGWDATGRAG